MTTDLDQSPDDAALDPSPVTSSSGPAAGAPPSDPTIAAVAEALALGQQGERRTARRALQRLWDRVGPAGDPLHRCGIAHALADVQDDPREELRWDRLALAAADGVTDEHLRRAGMPGTPAGLYPSLHLNLGDVYRRLGDDRRAWAHVEKGRTAVGALGDDGYARMIRGGLDRLADRLGPPGTAS